MRYLNIPGKKLLRTYVSPPDILEPFSIQIVYCLSFELYCNSQSNVDMKRLEQMQIENSWREEYEYYLQHFSRERRTNETFYPRLPLSQIANSHTLTVTNLFHAVKAKQPVQNIYKRPI
jgi:hypothetical protein